MGEHPPGRAGGRHGLVAAACALALAGTTAIAIAANDQSGPPPRPPAATAPLPAASHTTRQPALPASRPVFLSIPAIDVHTPLLRLGRNADGTVEVPDQPLRAGWYRYSPAPGQMGPAVILGHVDSDQSGPAVFFRLGALHPGDRADIRRADNTTAVFTIDAVREYPKDAFPTLTVYGNTDQPALRLITCGDWDSHTHSYRGNTVVFAHLTNTAQPPPGAPMR